MNLQAGALVGPFRIEAELGRGAMGAVFRATDLRSERQVALKVILKAEQATSAQRFVREAHVVARLSHPGIVSVHDAGIFGGVPCIVYELVEGGETLQDAFGKLLLVERAELVLEVAAALAYVHAEGLVHRDVKPGNVLIDGSGRARLTDFGLVGGEELERLTRTGCLVGTPAYMAPEQMTAEREAIGPHSDVWALGVMLYEALTGALPFEGDTAIELLVRAQESAPTPPSTISEGPIPRGAEVVCLRALAKEPHQRFPDAGAFHEALASVLDGSFRGESARLGALALGALALGALALTGALALSPLLSASPATSPEPSSSEPLAETPATPSEPSRSAREWTNLGRKALKEGRQREALAHVERALALDPQHTSALLIRGQAHHVLGEHALALAAFDALLALEPNRGDAYYSRATAEWDRHQAWLEAPDLNRSVETAEGYFHRAFARSRAKALPGALADYSEAIRRQPRFQAAYNNRGNLRADLGNLREALEDFDVSVELAGDVSSLLNRASVLSKLGRPDEAMADIDRALARAPKSVRALCAKAGALRAHKDLEGAERYLKRARELQPSEPRVRTQLAVLRAAQGRAQEAVAIYEELSAEDPRNGLYLNNLAAVHMDHGRLDLAESLLRRVLELEPRDATALGNLASLLMQRGQLQQARAIVQRASEAVPEDANLGLTSAAILLRLELPDEALAEVQRVLTLNPNLARAYYVRAKVRQDKSQLDLALSDVDRSLELDPDSAESLQCRGTLHLNAGSYQAALVDLDRLVQRQPSDKAYTYRGHARLRLGDEAGALADYDEAIRLNPRHKDAHNNRSAILSQSDKHREALSSLDALVEISPETPHYWYSRAEARFKLRDFRGAQEDAAKFRQLAPDDHDGAVLEGRAWQGLQEHERATRCFKAILAKAPKHPAALVYLADSLSALKRWEEVVEIHDRLIALLEPGSPALDTLRAARQQAATRAKQAGR